MFDALIAVLRRAIFPFKVLYYGHIFLALYLAGVLGLAFYGATKAIFYLNKFVKLCQDDMHLDPELVSKALGWIDPILWILTIPVALAAVILSARTVWRHRRLKFDELLALTPKSIALSFRSIVVTFRASLYLLAPALAMIFLYYAFVRKIETVSVYYTYSASCLMVCAVVLYKTLPVLMTPFIAICAESSAEYAISVSRAVLNNRRNGILAVLAAAFGIYYAALHLSMSWHALRYYGEIIRKVLACAGVWYAVTALTIITMEAITNFLGSQQTHPHVPPPPADGPATGRPAAPGVHVQKAWVKD